MFLNLKDFAPHSRRGGAVGTPPSRLSPIPPRFSAICDQKARALPPALAAECVLLAGRQGVSKKNHKGEKTPPLRFFTDILPLPEQRLLKPGGASPAFYHGFRPDRRYFACLSAVASA